MVPTGGRLQCEQACQCLRVADCEEDGLSWCGVRRSRLTAAQVQAAWASYIQVPVRLADIDVPQALELGMSLGMYAYDATSTEAGMSVLRS